MKLLCKHETCLLLFLVLVQIFGLEDDSSRTTTEICSTHTILPGPKGDEGQKGDSGDMGKQGKVGPMGPKGDKGAVGSSGDQGMMGKIGPIGRKGDKGLKGFSGASGGKGKAGAVCDCGKYRKVVGQLDINVARLKSSIKFVKNVLAGIRETDEKYYYIVQEEKNYREALTHCRIRDGILAMPKDEASNAVIADYISKSGLFRVFIGLSDTEREGQFIYADHTPLQDYSNWKEGEPQNVTGEEDCVEMLSTGKWNDTECHLTMYFVCEFPKKRK
ncbi:collectin-10 [Anolis carolinensis]|uniref:Collectin subfamily member 10 n=1 Tax=Anolis carolinensis TaxID=28377 RepID=A0A803TB85_ANOCA|nr:PREDICTED: collectin-10 [Anolis carolinensis]|eukprot:XP_003224877.1 PREDICTED: collectin-10 [Anolis carolinensis]